MPTSCFFVNEQAYAEWFSGTEDHLALCGKPMLDYNRLVIDKATGKSAVTCVIASRQVIPDENDWNSVIMCNLPGYEGRKIPDGLFGFPTLSAGFPGHGMDRLTDSARMSSFSGWDPAFPMNLPYGPKRCNGKRIKCRAHGHTLLWENAGTVLIFHAKSVIIHYRNGDGIMFNIGLGEIVIVLVVAFVIVGPDDLPKVARWLGRNLRKLRVFIRDIKKETGWDEIEKEVREVQRDVKETVREMDISADLKEAARDFKSEIQDIGKDVESDLKQLDQAVQSDLKTLDDEVRQAGNSEAVKDAADQ